MALMTGQIKQFIIGFIVTNIIGIPAVLMINSSIGLSAQALQSNPDSSNSPVELKSKPTASIDIKPTTISPEAPELPVAVQNRKLGSVTEVGSIVLDSSTTLDVDLSSSFAECHSHLRENRLTTGINGNALDCYNNILSISPNNEEAIFGLSAIEKKYLLWASSAISSGKKSKARSYIEKLKRVNPTSKDIVKLEQEFELRQRSGSFGTASSKTDSDDVTKQLMQKRRKKSTSGHYTNK